MFLGCLLGHGHRVLEKIEAITEPRTSWVGKSFSKDRFVFHGRKILLWLPSMSVCICCQRATEGIVPYCGKLFPLESAYYRIRIYNETGRVAESPIVPIAGKCMALTLIVLGNPVVDADIALLKFTARENRIFIRLTDASGREIGQYEVPSIAGSWNEFELPVPGLLAGVYVVHTSDGALAKMVVR
jgi:hypothetical protein